VVLSTHDVETALRAGGHAWLITRRPERHAGVSGHEAVVISGPIDRLAATGAINEAFDTAAVGFDAVAGTFRLR
jgi:hypothetical protein